MKAALLRVLLFCTGLALVMWAALPAVDTPAVAAPSFLVTETPPTEPPTLTPTATEIAPAPSITPVQSPSSTPPPADTATPEEPPPDRPRATATPTLPVEAATATALPTASPTPGGPGGPVADPAIEKSVSPSKAVVGQRVVYTITVTNLGSGTATGVRVDDTLPSFVQPTGVSTTRGQASLNGQSVQVLIGDLAPGETVTITIEATVVAPAPNDNRNLATVTSETPDSNPDNNQASVPLETDGPSSLPNTGVEEEARAPMLVLLLGVLGLALIGASIVVTHRATATGARRHK